MTNIPEAFLDLLQNRTVAHFSTIGPSGGPQVSPVIFDWDGTYISLTMTKARQKYRNVLREPRVSLSIVDPGNPFRSIEIRGRVERIEDDPDFRFAHSISHKYFNIDATIQPGEERAVVVIKPEKAFVFPPVEKNDR
ncbi:hypothetical protein EI42_01882 [Thermosporothrix hazakensis]|jgi:PPOX class probable F420-dependent enzyme|uniref:Pyridoxamine 5'-phosphate oxidase N-terminal domain-containing protein n=1 Tax=Thermosporothrix hazakensis TaxID=644383 RepID=A0A326U9S9_THEHA|nr:PPOX class F420-dependent oxidoreductase [Thermosporothrix hazakensis]PZW32790.1 hypothetical protein EI42_01882 [Thermosporothrix hazakensis]GCE50145.1 putative pyridoxamine 5'-phosphate oxidase [Thermosporothrix hazakensis]